MISEIKSALFLIAGKHTSVPTGGIPLLPGHRPSDGRWSKIFCYVGGGLKFRLVGGGQNNANLCWQEGRENPLILSYLSSKLPCLNLKLTCFLPMYNFSTLGQKCLKIGNLYKFGQKSLISVSVGSEINRHV